MSHSATGTPPLVTAEGPGSVDTPHTHRRTIEDHAMDVNIGRGQRMCRNLAISYSLTCNARCAHCGVWSSPEAKGKLGVETALRCISAAHRFGVKVVALTGGEPTVHLADILEIMRTSHERYGTVFSMTSNGWWGSSAGRAETTVAQLAHAGLVHLRLSADAFHQEFIPLPSVTRAVEASLARGVRTRVEVVVSRAHPESQAIWRHFRKYPVELTTQQLVPYGRASESFASATYPTASTHAVRTQVCLQAGQVTVDHHGDAWLCCNSERPPPSQGAERGPRSPFWVGSVHEEPFERILMRNERNLLCRVLHFTGPEGLRRLASEHRGGAVSLTERYPGLCALCTSILAPGPAADAVHAALVQLQKQVGPLDAVVEAPSQPAPRSAASLACSGALP